MKKIVLLILLAPLLMATTCESDYQQTIFNNNYKVKITNQTNLNVNDIIWIEGRVSSKVYNSQIGDSTFVNYTDVLNIEIYKLTTPTSNYNAIGAIDKFELIYPNELISLDGCNKTSTVTHVSSILNSTGNMYKIKLGLKAKESGDYIIHIPSQKFENTELNLSLINNYPSPNNSYFIGFKGCRYSYSIEKANTDVGVFCFTVN